MILTKTILSPFSFPILSSTNGIHGWVERSFPEEFEEGIVTRKLWRIEEDGRTVLIVSEKEPDISKLEEYAVKGSTQTQDYDRFLKEIREEEQYYFKATLNPVKNHNGKTRPITNQEEQLKFLEEKSLKNGFHLEQARIIQKGQKKFHKGKHKVNLVSANYEGILTVTDKELMVTALTKGIGKKKAFGFGLMTIFPIKRTKKD